MMASNFLAKCVKCLEEKDISCYNKDKSNKLLLNNIIGVSNV